MKDSCHRLRIKYGIVKGKHPDFSMLTTIMVKGFENVGSKFDCKGFKVTLFLLNIFVVFLTNKTVVLPNIMYLFEMKMHFSISRDVCVYVISCMYNV